VAKFIVETYHEIAEFFGVAEGTIKSEWTPAGMPGERPRGKRKGRYDLSEIVQWYRATFKGAAAGGISAAMQKAKLAEQVAKARERKVRADQAEQAVISREDHNTALVAFGRVVLTELQAAAAKIRNAQERRTFVGQTRALRTGIVEKLKGK
jgi:phage terminase Nu1 subunit (DNA packaging protein)